MKKDNFSSNKWPLARVAEVHPAADGINRVVTLKLHWRMARCPIEIASRTDNQFLKTNGAETEPIS